MKTEMEELLGDGPVVINIGVREFAEKLEEQGGEADACGWTSTVPPRLPP